jgi:pectinesterase
MKQPMRSAVLVIVVFLLCDPVRADVTVAADGSGQFKTVQEAVDASPNYSPTRTVIRIKPGTYKQKVVVPKQKRMLSFIGEDPRMTVLTFDLVASVRGADGKTIGTFGTPSTQIEADDFVAENITFENSAGPRGQALAITVIGDRAVFRNCRFLGWQDTLLAQTGRQLFENCYIAGHVDFIFGGSTAWFEKCQIHCLRTGYIAAASTPHDQAFGYVFNNCKITAEADDVRILLGRPWRADAGTIYLNCEMPANVSPVAWSNWNRPDKEKTARYAEYNTTGPGAKPSERAPWTKQLTEAEAKEITLEKVLGGIDRWDPRTDKFAPPSYKVPATLPATEPVKAADGKTYRVTVEGKSLAISSSTDGATWSPPKVIDIMNGLNALDLNSPRVFHDETSQQYIIFWASTIAQNFFQSYQEPVNDSPRLWYTITRDFETFAPAKVLFEPGYPSRDGALIRDGARYLLLHEDSRQMMRGLRVATSPDPIGPWGPSSDLIEVKP